MIASYVGENAEFERQYLNGELEVELTPQVRWFLCLFFKTNLFKNVIYFPPEISLCGRTKAEGVLFYPSESLLK